MADDLSTETHEDGTPRRLSTTLPVETRSAAVTVDGVDFGQRIITVLAVPYEQPTPVPFQQEQWTEVFSRSAFKGIESLTRKIPATAALEVPAPNHDGGRLVGKVISSDPYQSEGLVSEIKISRTPLGDETLELANDEALSVSIGFMVKNRLDQDLDRRQKTRRINRAFLDHLAFVGQPAYPGAKVLAMRSDGSVEEEDVSMGGRTPRMDEFLNDPILKWAADRCRQP